MVNNQTSQYVILNFLYMSCLGVFQYVRDILQVTVLIDHPVALILVYNLNSYSCQDLGLLRSFAGQSDLKVTSWDVRVQAKPIKRTASDRDVHCLKALA